jgi:DNA-binding LacI/PurR family transcriptional regulator
MSLPITHQLIAERAGVSKAAVSCALRGRANISVTTRRRIQQVAESLGYRPNPLLAAHMAHLRTFKKTAYQATLALLAAGRPATEEERHLQSRYQLGCYRRAEELSYRVERFDPFAPETSGARLGRVLTSRGIHGLLVAPLDREDFPMLDWNQFAGVALGHSLQTPRLHRVTHNHFKTMEQLLQRLVHLGYRRAGFAMSEAADRRVNHSWLGGFLAHRHFQPTLGAVPPLVTADWTRATFLAWFETHQPDVVISSTADAWGWLRESGRHVPADVGFANVFWNAANVTCSGVDQDFERLGAAAVDLLVSMLNRNERGLPAKPTVLEVDGDWRDGQTLRTLSAVRQEIA